MSNYSLENNCKINKIGIGCYCSESVILALTY